MNKEQIKNVEKLIKNSKSGIISTTNGVVIYGNIPDIMCNISMLIKELKEQIPEEMVKYSIDLGLMNKEELLKETKNKLKDLIDEIEK